MTAFLAEADAICDASNRTLTAPAEPAARPELAAAAARVTTGVDTQLTQLREQKTPGGESAKQITAFWETMAAVSQSTGALQRSAAGTDDAAAAKASADTKARYQESSSQATVLGFTSCSVGMKPAMDQLGTGTKAVIKASYLAKGDAICDTAEKALDAVPAPSTKSLVAVGRALDKVVALIEKAVNDLKALPAPPGDEAVVAELNGAQAAAVTLFKNYRNAAVANDAQKVLAMSDEFDRVNTAADDKMRAYGFKACG